MAATVKELWARERLAVAAVAALSLTGGAFAQESTNVAAATQPAVGNWYLKQRLQFIQLREDPSSRRLEIDELVSTTTLSVGLTRNLALSFEVPTVLTSTSPGGSDVGRSVDVGLQDPRAELKWRPLQWDLNPIDSVRVAFTAGLEVPSGDGDYSSHSFDPFAGVIFTTILGRHGFNAALQYKFNQGGDGFTTRPGDGPDDAFRYDASYLFRLVPAAYEADTPAATYLTFEMNGLYETNGDNEIHIGPGLLYEAREFAIEATLHVPVTQDVRHRVQQDLIIGFGFRVLF